MFCIRRLAEQELFRVNLPLPGLYVLSTTTTATSALRRVPDNPVLPWVTFLDNALTASLTINNTARKFNNRNINRPFVSSQSTTVSLFLRTMNEINNKRLRELPKPEKW